MLLKFWISRLLLPKCSIGSLFCARIGPFWLVPKQLHPHLPFHSAPKRFLYSNGQSKRPRGSPSIIWLCFVGPKGKSSRRESCWEAAEISLTLRRSMPPVRRFLRK